MRSLLIGIVALIVLMFVGCSSPTDVESTTKYILTTEGFYRTDFNFNDSTTFIYQEEYIGTDLDGDAEWISGGLYVPIPWYHENMLVSVHYDSAYNLYDRYEYTAGEFIYAFSIRYTNGEPTLEFSRGTPHLENYGDMYIIGISMPDVK